MFEVTAQGARIAGPYLLLDAQADLASSGVMQTRGKCRGVGFQVECRKTQPQGSNTIESAISDDFAGDWATLATIDAVDHGTYLVQRDGWGMAYRVRISSAIVGGTVTVYGGGIL